MATINVKCKHCGNNMSFDTEQKTVTCSYCGSNYQASELLNETDLAFIEKLKPQEVENKIEANVHIKNGEMYIYQAQFIKAEHEFKKAISLDTKNFHAYYGMVKAKTHNFSLLPEGDGYKEYAKSALKVAPKDEQEYLKNEFVKLDLLEKERTSMKKQQQEKAAAAAKKESKKRKRSDLISTVLYFLIFAATAIALIVVIVQKVREDYRHAEENSTVQISTVEDLTNFMTKKEYLSATIVLKNDIDFEGKFWTPVGTAANPFSGKFFGGNHTIKNLKILDTNHADENYIGLFGFAKNATITGLKLDGVTILSANSSEDENFKTTFAGLIVARANDSQIKLCEILNTCKIEITNKSNNALVLGGITGYAKNSTISQCASHANITANAAGAKFVSNADSTKYAAGGVVGKLENSGLTYSYSSSTLEMAVTGENNHDEIFLYMGGVVGNTVSDSQTKFYINFCFFTGKISSTLNSDVKTENSQKTAGIVANCENFTNFNSNFAFFETNFYVENSNSLLSADLSDTENATYKETEDDVIDFVKTNFSPNIWQNTDTISPSLKKTNSAD